MNPKTLYDHMLAQMAAESYLPEIDFSNTALVRTRLDFGSNNPLNAYIQSLYATDPNLLPGPTRLTNTQIGQFLSTWEIVDHRSNNDSRFVTLSATNLVGNASGFSATLLRNQSTGEFTLSMRSTEFANESQGGDWNRDGISGADGEIGNHGGFAYAQIAAMEDYYADLKRTGRLPTGAKLNVTGYSLGGNLATVFSELHPTEVNQVVVFNAAGIGRSTRGTTTDIVNHFLAQLRAANLPATLGSGSLYSNAAYVAARDATKAEFLPTYPLFGTENASVGGGKLLQYYGRATNDDTELVANSGYHPAATKMFIEDQPNIQGTGIQWNWLQTITGVQSNFGATHSITLLADSLAVMALLERIQPTLTFETMYSMFAAASNERASDLLGTAGTAESDSLEKIVEGLRKIYVGTSAELPVLRSGNGFAHLGNREAFHQAIAAVQTAVGAAQAEVVNLASMKSTEMAASARSTDATGLAYRYALVALQPFVVKAGAEIYAQHNPNGELALVDPATGTGTLTDRYLDDRAALLERKLYYSTHNTRYDTSHISDENDKLATDYDHQRPYDDVVWNDLGSGLKIQRGGTSASTRYISFGGNGADTALPSGSRADHLYGGVGDDQIAAGGGGDYLEGNAGADVLRGEAGEDDLLGGEGADEMYGGAEADRLTGGAGDDRLEGGTGLDTYIVGAGRDTILDEDGLGVIKTAAGTQLAGVFIKQGGQYVWANDTAVSATQSGGTLTVQLGGGASVEIRDFAAGKLGLSLAETGTIEPGRTILGDLQPQDFEPETAGVQTRPDELGNVIVTATPEPDRPDVLNDSTGADLIRGEGGDDSISAWRGGDDQLHGGAGRDEVYGNAGDDIVEGGADADILDGGAGKDAVYGGEKVDVLAAIALGETQGATGLKGDWISGGSGDDVLIGGANGEVLTGGAGADLIIAGAGDDNIIANSNWITTSFDWYYYDQAGYRVFATASGEQFPVDDLADVVYAGAGADYVFSGFGADFLDGGLGNDSMSGEWGDDQLYGRDGDDSLRGDSGWAPDGEPGQDLLDGGTGSDWLRGDGGADRLFGGDDNDTLLGDDPDIDASFHGADYLDGGAGDDTLSGHGGADTLLGGDGRDDLRGDAGDDNLDGGADDDTLRGDAGSDLLIGGAGGDTLSGNGEDESAAEIDYLFGEDGRDFAYGNGGDDFISGGSGADELTGGAGNDVVHGDSEDDKLWGGTGADALSGGSGADTILGEADNDYLNGGVGADTLDGGDGDDVIEGGDGDDVLIGGAGADTLIGGAGNDRYVFDALDTIIDHDGHNTIAFAASISGADVAVRQTFIGEQAGYVITVAGRDAMITTADPASTFQFQFGGDDPIAQDEFYRAHIATGVTANGTSANDSLQGYDRADSLSGHDGADTLQGYGDADLLDGGSGADVLEGGAGDDLLIGGSGSDTYRFAAGDGDDRIDDRGLAGEIDTLLLTSVTDRSAVTFVRQADGDLVVSVPATGDSVTLAGWYTQPANRVERIELGDGSVIDEAELAALPVLPIVGTSFNDVLEGTSGSDVLRGGDGSDTYVFERNAGMDRIEDAFAQPSLIRLSTAVSFDDIALERQADDLVLRVRGSTSGMTVANFFGASGDWSATDASGVTRDLSDWWDAVSAAQTSRLDVLRAEYIGAVGNQFAAGWAQSGYAQAGTTHVVRAGQTDVTAYSLAAVTIKDLIRFDADELMNPGISVLIGPPPYPAGVVLTSRAQTTQVLQPFVLPTEVTIADEQRYAWTTLASDAATVTVPYTYADVVRYERQTDRTLYASGMYVEQYATDFTWTASPLEPAEQGGPPSPSPVPPPDYLIESEYLLHTNTTYKLADTPLDENPIAIAAKRNAHTYQLYEVQGGASANTIAHARLVDGGAGNDRIFADWQVPDYFWPRVQTPAMEPILGDGAFLYGNDGSDDIKGGPRSDLIIGGDDDDVLDGGAGADRYVALATDTGWDIIADSGSTYIELPWRWDYMAPGYVYEFEQSFNDWLRDYMGATAPAQRIATDDPEVRRANAAAQDVIELAPGIRAQDLTVTWGLVEQSARFGSSSLPQRSRVPTLDVSWAPGTGIHIASAVEIGREFDQGIERVEFADGSSLSLSALQAMAARPADWITVSPIDAPREIAATSGTRAVVLQLPSSANWFFYTASRVGADLVFTPASGSATVRLDDWFATPAAQRIDVLLEYPGTGGLGRWIDFGRLDLLNRAPTLSQPIGAQSALEDAAFSLAIPASTFADADANDTLAYSATLANGDPLPAWLSFDAATRTLSGTPTNGDVGSLTLRVRATDSWGESATADFDLAVVNVNDAPVLTQPLANQSAQEKVAFGFTVPTGTFVDVDAGDTLAYSATLANGDPLPAWLAFDAATRTFAGVPPQGTAGTLAISVSATDQSGATAVAPVTFDIAAAPGVHLVGTSGANTLDGTPGDDWLEGLAGADTLNGGAGDDLLDGGNGADTLAGGADDDTLYGHDGTDTLRGDDGADRLYGGGATDKLYAGSGDDWLEGGDGADLLYADPGQDVLVGGGNDDKLYGDAGDDYLVGGAGKDTLAGEAGTDLLQGGDNDDTLIDTAGRNLLDGQAGKDKLTAGDANDLVVGGRGNDTLTTGAGADVILFNVGDGQDTVLAGTGADNTLSLGGNLRYEDLTLSKSGADLVLEVSATDKLTFKDWYADTPTYSVLDLQVVAEAMAAFDAQGADPLQDDKIERFDFAGIVGAFDAARSANPVLSDWALTEALTAFHLSGSDSAALGGDLAYQYGRYGHFGNVGTQGALNVLGDASFGATPQTFQLAQDLQAGVARLS